MDQRSEPVLPDPWHDPEFSRVRGDYKLVGGSRSRDIHGAPSRRVSPGRDANLDPYSGSGLSLVETSARSDARSHYAVLSDGPGVDAGCAGGGDGAGMDEHRPFRRGRSCHRLVPRGHSVAVGLMSGRLSRVVPIPLISSAAGPDPESRAGSESATRSSARPFISSRPSRTRDCRPRFRALPRR
jgi:hypothetical protein